MGKVLWFTGLSGSGKSTLAENLKIVLKIRGINSIILDGDIIRKGLCSDLSFSKKDRKENIRRISEVAKILTTIDKNIIIMVAFISPYIEDRNKAREIIGENFYEIYLDTPLKICEKRDVKGLYKKVRNGEIKNFTGITDPYEPPINPEIKINTNKIKIIKSMNIILKKIKIIS